MTRGAPSGDVGETVGLRRRPWWMRVSGPQVFVILAGLLAFLANLAVLRARTDSALVAVAAVDLSPGTVLDVARHLTFVEIDGSSDLVERSIVRADSAAYEGHVLAAPLARGDLVNRSQLRDAAAHDGLRAMSIPVDAANAAGGDIAIGDRVDVIAVEGAVAQYVLVGAEVIGRSNETSGSTLAASRGFYLVVGVTADEALALSSALSTAEIQIIRATGATAPERLLLDPGATDQSSEGG